MQEKSGEGGIIDEGCLGAKRLILIVLLNRIKNRNPDCFLCISKQMGIIYINKNAVRFFEINLICN